MRLMLIGLILMGQAYPNQKLDKTSIEVGVAQPQMDNAPKWEILPTPSRILMRAKKDLNVLTDFVGGEDTVQLKPLVSIRSDQAESLSDYQAKLDYQLKQRMKHFQALNEAAEVEFNPNLLGTDTVYFELGGISVFQSYNLNRLIESSLANSVKSPVVFPSLWLNKEISDLKNKRLEIRIFHFDAKLPKFYANAVRSSFKDKTDDYYQLIGRYIDQSGLHKGLSEEANTFSGFILNSCIAFENLGHQSDEPVYDDQSFCWVYDWTQYSDQVLAPFTPGVEKSAGYNLKLNSIIEWDVFDQDSHLIDSEYTVLKTKMSTPVDLKGQDWKESK